MEIQYIKYGTEEYKESIILRDEVLRIPWGRSIKEDDLTLEDGFDILIGGFINNKLKGVIVLHPLDENEIQIKYLAVSKDSRGLGIGRKLVLETEKYALNNNYKKIFLESRDTAVNFYKELNYIVIDKPFMPEFVPILHIPMIKDI
ncbi:GNAT family N-acetyltransferase [Miniphocaeibacter halophilus]|uniref:GNAT family N-acetyltransferase n=1 Tax=Miniphocaeibacter halophilus TaxID=2931922 RepID=A0AC61MVP0_9FIRM|nr:GNAT family N-acetyltransferase [Miniphocaeibacter halophilus]QQK08086.1 GNAT family N-acetyltransferase [Miniphocaeibacter halophilus]